MLKTNQETNQNETAAAIKLLKAELQNLQMSVSELTEQQKLMKATWWVNFKLNKYLNSYDYVSLHVHNWL